MEGAGYRHWEKRIEPAPPMRLHFLPSVDRGVAEWHVHTPEAPCPKARHVSGGSYPAC
jgi:hypothetical protein